MISLESIRNFLNLPASPAKPVKGKGNDRCCFPLVRRSEHAKLLWDAIPKSHKAELTYSRGSSLRYRGTGGNIVISPEAYEAVTKMGV